MYVELVIACSASTRISPLPRNDSSRLLLKNVGMTTDTCVPAARSSPHSVSLIDSAAAFVALYAIMPGEEANAAALATLISRPEPLRCR